MCLVGHHLDPGIDGGNPVRPGDDGAEVQVGNLGQVVGELGDPQQDVAQSRDIGGGSAPVAEQQRRGADGADQRVRVRVSQRGESRGVVGEHLGGDATEPEDHERAEHVVVGHPDGDLRATRRGGGFDSGIP